jgi:hypothetical protein
MHPTRVVLDATSCVELVRADADVIDSDSIRLETPLTLRVLTGPGTRPRRSIEGEAEMFTAEMRIG